MALIPPWPDVSSSAGRVLDASRRGHPLPNEKRDKPEIKVTDRRMFTSEGDLREEFRQNLSSAPAAAQPEPPPTTKNEPPPPPPPPKMDAAAPPTSQSERRTQNKTAPSEGDRRRTVAERAESPNTPFAMFIQSLVAQAYMMLGMLRNPYQPQVKPDAAAARELIDILVLLQEKTAGNLTLEEEEFLATHLGQLKLAYVQVTKNLS